MIAGNDRLKKDVENINPNIIVIPTPVDTDFYEVNPEKYQKKKCVRILWSGNRSGHNQLNYCAETIKKLSKKYDIEFIVLSDSSEGIDRRFYEGELKFLKWSLENEKKAFGMADIGIMILNDTLWNRRKCAFKALLYMANGIPVVSSPVGVIKNIIKDGINGFFANDCDEWFEKLELLIQNPSLRRKMGLKGRETVEKYFSLRYWASKWVKVIEKTARMSNEKNI